jgi:hypothetical protein
VGSKISYSQAREFGKRFSNVFSKWAANVEEASEFVRFFPFIWPEKSKKTFKKTQRVSVLFKPW